MTYLVDTDRKKVFGPYGKDFSLVVTPTENGVEVEVWHVPTANMVYVHDFKEMTIEPDIDFFDGCWDDYTRS